MNELQNKAEENSSANPNSTPAALRELYSAIVGADGVGGNSVNRNYYFDKATEMRYI